MDTFRYEKEIPSLGHYDVCVVGGGPAGVAAAICAARQGKRTVLIEGTAALGGMATSGLVGPFMTNYDRDGKEKTVDGIFGEIVRRLSEHGHALPSDEIFSHSVYTSFIDRYHAHVTPFHSFRLEHLLDGMTRESGVRVLCYTHFSDAVAEDGVIRYLLVSAPEGLRAVSAEVYVDATGIAALAACVGVPTYKGDEKSGIPQPATLMFEVEGVDDDAFARYGERPPRPVKVYRTPTKGRYKVNHYHIYNVDAASAASLTEAHAEARGQIDKAIEVLREQTPGFESATLCAVAPVLGTRESRHILGDLTITVDDVRLGTKFDDRIAVYGFGMDIHSRTEQAERNFRVEVAERYYIPYRALIPRNVKNLLVAGKTISCQSEAVGGMRCMPAAFAMGQAAGVACALACEVDADVRRVDISRLQSILRECGAILD